MVTLDCCDLKTLKITLLYYSVYKEIKFVFMATTIATSYDSVVQVYADKRTQVLTDT